MAELTPIPTAPRGSEADYQPLAGFAIAAIVTAGIFVVVLATVLIVSFVQKRPTLSYEMLLLPFACLVFAILGRQQIRRSEGTRSGLKITSVAWWIAVLGGGGFLSYVLASSYVLEREAVRFTDRFLMSLKNGDVHSAFLDTMEASVRNSAPKPSDKEAFEQEFLVKGLVPFRNHPVVHLFQRNGKEMQWEHLGGRNLTQEGGTFNMAQIYRLTCPEGVFELAVGITSKDNRKGLVSQWQIAGARGEIYIKLTPEKKSRYGQNIDELLNEAGPLANVWAEQMNAGRMTQAHLLTMPVEYRTPLLDRIGLTAHLAGSVVVPQPMTNNILPVERQIKDKTGNELAFDDLYANNFFKYVEAGEEKAFPSEKFDIIRRLWITPRLFPTQFGRPGPDNSAPPDGPRVVVTPEQVTVLIPYDMQMSNTSYLRIMVGMQTDSAEFMSKLNEARREGAGAKADPTTSISRGPDRQWRVAFVRSDMVTQTIATGQGPGGPGGGR